MRPGYSIKKPEILHIISNSFSGSAKLILQSPGRAVNSVISEKNFFSSAHGIISEYAVLIVILYVINLSGALSSPHDYCKSVTLLLLYLGKCQQAGFRAAILWWV